MKKFFAIMLVLILGIVSAPAYVQANGSTPVTVYFPGGTATTGPGAWGGMAGVRYPVAFDVGSCPLKMTIYDLDMSGVNFTKVNPCCGPVAGDAGLGAYAQVGIAADTRVIDWPENGVQMFVTSVIGWNPATEGSGSWNNQSFKYTHDSTRDANDGLGYRKYLEQCWYNPIDDLDPRVPWTNDFNKWNFQYNPEKYMGGVGDPECDTFDLRLQVTQVNDSPKTYRVEWWVRLHAASSWNETNKTSNWGGPWNGAVNNAATGTADLENDGTCIDEVPAETARVNGAWYRVRSPQTPGNPYFDVTNVDFSVVYPHVGVHNGGNAANVGHTINWSHIVVEGCLGTVIIDGCDTGVPDQLLDDGTTISWRIAGCAAAASNHGEFVKCVSHLTNDLVSDGYLTGKEKGRIVSCAARADIP